MNPKVLYYFTESFPYGLGETWKLNELNVLVNEFNEIHVVPLYHHGNLDNPKKLPDKIIVHQPLMGVSIKQFKPWAILEVFDSNFFYYLSDFFSKKVYLDKKRYIKWMISVLRIKKLLHHPFIKQLIDENNPHAYFYFFWGVGAADVVPFLNKSLTKKIMVRMHRFDLFENEVGNYIPFRLKLIKHSSLIAPSSKAGENHLRLLYSGYSNKINVKMLGVKSFGKSKQLHDGIFRIVTVSYMAPVKRLSILANALKDFHDPLEWTHLGDGPLRSDIEGIVKTLPSNIKVNLIGMVESTKVQDILVKQPFNLFLNISESEGVPFSIMEALAAGIPVMATDVGGTAEIIDNTVGRLLPKALTPEMLCKELLSFNKLNTTEKEKKAEQAYQRYLSHCDSEKLTKEIANELKKLS